MDFAIVLFELVIINGGAVWNRMNKKKN